MSLDMDINKTLIHIKAPLLVLLNSLSILQVDFGKISLTNTAVYETSPFFKWRKKTKEKKDEKAHFKSEFYFKKIYIVPTIPGDLLSTHNQIIEL